VLAATARVARDLDLAEECVQEAYAAALATWARDGIPKNPTGWITTAARRRAIDVLRRELVFRSKLPLLIEPEEPMDEVSMEAAGEAESQELRESVPDERLRLIFLCCHPSLAQEAQLALTLRLVCGVSTRDIARAFLVSESTMAARLTRAKKKISTARIPYRVPRTHQLPDRLHGVLGVIHLLFTAGHTAPSGASLMRLDLMDQALHLARMLRELMPAEREVRGLLALLLVTDARRSTRVDGHGRLLRLQEQDRSQWDHAAIAEAETLIVAGLRGGPPGRYVLQAAIASLYVEAPTYEQTDWAQIVELYDALLAVWPSSIVALNRAVAVAETSGPVVALAEVEQLELGGDLDGYQYLPAVKADLLRRLGRSDDASAAYERALELTQNEAEREFLLHRLQETDLGERLARGRAASRGCPLGGDRDECGRRQDGRRESSLDASSARAPVSEQVGEAHEQRCEQHVDAADDHDGGPGRFVAVVHHPETDERAHSREGVAGADAERPQVHVRDAVGLDAEELLRPGTIDQEGLHREDGDQDKSRDAGRELCDRVHG
jgi:RNA polymerase sigma-70 factor (ECF subfamily)